MRWKGASIVATGNEFPENNYIFCFYYSCNVLAMLICSRFLYQGDESFVHTKSHQLLTHDYTRRPFHSGTPPSMDEDSDLPILDLQQQSLVEQVMEQWGHGAAANMTLENIPPSSPPTTNCKETLSPQCICPITFLTMTFFYSSWASATPYSTSDCQFISWLPSNCEM